ncbi:MAG: N-acetylmuramoyl-L-alanine amidase [Roseburia sp.]|nr:N-acetylmuramoyl-L-alanine amidase [Roseburia sp.]
MKSVRRITALLLALLLSLTTGYTDALAASFAEPLAYISEEGFAPEGTEETTETAEESSEISDVEAVPETEDPRIFDAEIASEMEDQENEQASETENTEELSGTEGVLEEETEEKAQGKNESIGLVNYVVVEEPVVETPGTQRIMTSIGDGTSEVESAVLTYENRETGEFRQVSATEILDDFVLFAMDFPKGSKTGTYQLASLTYSMQGLTTTTAFAQMGVDASFGVNEVPETTPDDVLLTEEEFEALSENVEANIVSLDENADTQVIEEALESAGCDADVVLTDGVASKVKGASPKGMSSLVVVLDPGHGGNDGGASHNGLVEKNLNLKIGLYCREELEKYAGVNVIMTRQSDVSLTLAERAQVAIDNRANVFVSLHINSNTSAGPNGANVYYPNNNYNSTAGTTGKNLAAIIESKLTDLGLASGGIHIRNSENNTRYPDGSLADYYGVIKRCKENGIPGLIVEHAFISNINDVKNYLSSDESLKKLGVADATGIAEYFGLKKGLGFTSILATGSESLKLTWKKVSGVSGYEIRRSEKSDGDFKKIATINSADTTTYTDTGLTPGKVYYYKIRTFTKSGGDTKYGSYSKVESGGTIAKTSISSLKSKTNKSMEISWSVVGTAAGYEISRSTSKDGSYAQIAMIGSQSQSSYVDSSVKEGKLYYYKIRVIGREGTDTIYSDWSKAVSGRTAKKPSKLKVSSKNSTTLHISWTGDKNAAGYTIKRAESKNGKYTKVGTVKGGDTTTYDNKNVKKGKTYYYKVETYNYNGEKKGYSGYSSAASGRTLTGTSITKVESTSSTKQTITWKKNNEANGYQIYQSTSKDGTYKKIKTISNKKTTSYKVTGLKPGVKYFYKVRCTNKVNSVTGYSDYSTIRGARVAKAVIKQAEGASGTKIKLTWDKVKDADSFVIYRSTSSGGTYSKIGTAKGTATSYTDSNLQMTKKYFYKLEVKMKGYKVTGTSGKSKAVSAYPIRQTEIASVEAGDTGALVVRWSQVKDIKGYEVYRSTQEDGTYNLLTTVDDYSVTSYEDASAEPSVSYWYKIRLVNTYNGKTIYGGYSAPVEGSTLAAPGNVTVTQVSDAQLDISWTAVNNAAGYIIYRSTQPEGEFTEIARVGSATSYSDTTVVKDTVYYYKVKTYDENNRTSIFSSTASGCAVAKLLVTNASFSGTAILVAWTKSGGSVDGYELYRSSSEKVTAFQKIVTTKDTSFQDMDVKTNVTYYYRVRSYTTASGKKIYGSFSDTLSTNPSDYRIMGAAGATAAQMAAMYRLSGKSYPSSVYTSKGAPDLQTFCQIVYDECVVEGVKPEVLFAQICHETGYLGFGGQVKAEQCNFGGLGALDGGTTGAEFPDVVTGIRSQVQHLKAYASVDSLRQPCVDPRFGYVVRGQAEYVQQLGRGNWATDKAYAEKLMNIINKIKSM